MPPLQFDKQSAYQKNIKKYELKLTTPLMKFNERGMIFVTWWQVNDDKSVYDTGFRESDHLLGPDSGVRYNKIEHLGVSLQTEVDANVQDEVPGVLDISHEGSVLVFPNTIVPNPNKDFFMIEHLQMRAIFRVTGIDYDHMRVDGYYKCDYILDRTDADVFAELERQTVATYVMNMKDFGTDQNPIIRKDHLEYIRKLEFVYADIADLYMNMFYNERHECLLWYDINLNRSVYDECLQHFVSTHSLLSIPDSGQLVIFDHKLEEPKFDYLYSRSLWRWIERDAPIDQLEKFHYNLSGANRYIDSTFHEWGHQSFSVRWPILARDSGASNGTYFDDRIYNILLGRVKAATSYEKVMKLFVTGELRSPEQIPLDLYQELLDGCNEFHLFVYTPIIMYIIRMAMKFR